MATYKAIIDEIADVLGEDFSLNQFWSRDYLLNTLKVNLGRLGSETLCRDGESEESVSSSGLVTFGYEAIVPYHVRWYSSGSVTVLDIEDIRLMPLGSGVTSPLSPSTPKFMYMSKAATGGKITGRLLPWTSASGTTCECFYKSEINHTGVSLSTVSAGTLFHIPAKFRTISDAFSERNQASDMDRSKVFGSLADLLTNALKSLYQGAS